MVKIKKPATKTMKIGAGKPPLTQKAKSKAPAKLSASKIVLDTDWDVQVIKTDKKHNDNVQKDTKTNKSSKDKKKHLTLISNIKEEPTENFINSVPMRQNKDKKVSTPPHTNKNGKKSFIKATDETGKEIAIKSEWGKMQHVTSISNIKEEPTENFINTVPLRQNKDKKVSTLPYTNKNGKKSFIKARDETGKEIAIKSKWGEMQLSEAPKKEILDEKFNVDVDVIKKAASGVFTLIRNKQEEKNELFDDAQPVFLQIVAIKVPFCPWRIIRLPIKHSLLTEESEVCLIAADDMKIGRKKHDRVIEHFEQLLKANGIDVVKRILPYHELQTEYNQYELKRRLADQYDTFLVEGKIDGYVLRKLGKIFFKKHKLPTPVKLEPADIKKSIESALLKVPLYMHTKGDSYSIKIGHTNMSEKEITENVCRIIESLEEEFPGGFENIRSLHLKGINTPSCPIYVTLKDKSLVKVPVIKRKRPKYFVPVEGELTTRTNVAVKVYPSGHIVTSTLEESAPDDDNNDEEEEVEEQTAGLKEMDENDDDYLTGEDKQSESNDEIDSDKIKKTITKRKSEVSKKGTKSKKQKK